MNNYSFQKTGLKKLTQKFDDKNINTNNYHKTDWKKTIRESNNQVKHLYSSPKYEVNKNLSKDEISPYNKTINDSKNYTTTQYASSKYDKTHRINEDQNKDIKNKHTNFCSESCKYGFKSNGCPCTRSNKPCACHLSESNEDQEDKTKYVKIKNDDECHHIERNRINYVSSNELPTACNVNRNKNCCKITSKTNQNKIKELYTHYARYADKNIRGKNIDEEFSKNIDEESKIYISEHFSKFSDGKYDFKPNINCKTSVFDMDKITTFNKDKTVRDKIKNIVNSKEVISEKSGKILYIL